ncbi:MAG TPA: ABC transporter ATP-binding protein [Candidatus Copromorpha excrementigallinarum]|uniref:ABC transporter ATP-binding protein n=1 Tax=Candidatus Allocopromorpha excrementigallinarum TaxID=2840742 RepID=A0A9D1L770_9FIRM|nr:ABC transporter ATP-binding protein [Candidatus Copromorpha excrementigallinarum]
MEEILKVSNVTKYYGTGSVVTKALNGISFTVGKGEFTAIMGASGSGKSTLLNVISTIDRVSSGDIYLEGTNLAAMKENQLSKFRRDKLGFIFQEYNLLDTLTVRENIALPLNLKRASMAKTGNMVNKVSAVLGVTGQLDKFPYELSGGERQRVACARAIITNPAIVLADEPTGALDSKNSGRLMKTFEMMNRDLGSTILMVTHDALVGSYAGRVLFLKDGRLWSEVNRGKRDRAAMYRDILSVMASLGGDVDVR